MRLEASVVIVYCLGYCSLLPETVLGDGELLIRRKGARKQNSLPDERPLLLLQQFPRKQQRRGHRSFQQHRRVTDRTPPSLIGNLFARRGGEQGAAASGKRQKSGEATRSNKSEGSSYPPDTFIPPPTVTPDPCHTTSSSVITQLQDIGVIVDTSIQDAGSCEMNSVEMQVFRHLLTTSITDIDTFLVQPDGLDAIDPLQGLMMLFQDRLDATTSNVTLPSHRDILTALMIPDDTNDEELGVNRRELQVRVPTEAEINCVVKKLQVAAAILGLVLEVNGLSSGNNVAQKVVDHILDTFIRRSNVKILRILAIPIDFHNALDAGTQILWEVLTTVAGDQLSSTFRDSMTPAEWWWFGLSILLDITLVVAAGVSTAGVGSAAVIAAKIAVLTKRLQAAQTFVDVSLLFAQAQEACKTTSPPTSLPTPFLSTPSPTSLIGGLTSGVFGDPHLATFDGLRFDCQASGEFIMVKSLDNPGGLLIQERFSKAAGSTICSQASISTGIAIAEEQVATIQLSIPVLDQSDGRDIESSGFVASCPVDLFVDGNRLPLSNFDPTPNVDVLIQSGSSIVVQYPLTGIRVTVNVRNAARTFGCHFGVQVFIPYDYILPEENLVGLLGKPNLNSLDDWVDPTGSSFPGPVTEEESIFGAAYDYCVSNWCIRDESKSIFTYRSDHGESFAMMSGCDSAYASQELETEVANADASLVALCDGSAACLVDGICGNFDDATATLQDEAEVAASQTRLLLPFDFNSNVYSDFTLTFSPTEFFRHQIAFARISQDGYVVLYSGDDNLAHQPTALVAAFWAESALLTDLWTEDSLYDYGEQDIRFTEGDSDLQLAQSVVRLVEANGGSSSNEFTATTAIVATWRNSQRFDFSQAKQENMFQLVLVFGTTATQESSTWAIVSYQKIEFFGLKAVVGSNDGGGLMKQWFLVQSDEDIEHLLSDTNCGRAGTYAFRVSAD